MYSHPHSLSSLQIFVIIRVYKWISEENITQLRQGVALVELNNYTHSGRAVKFQAAQRCPHRTYLDVVWGRWLVDLGVTSKECEAATHCSTPRTTEGEGEAEAKGVDVHVATV